jgi:hypothetical protein
MVESKSKAEIGKAESRNGACATTDYRLQDYETTRLSLVKVMGADGHGPDGFALNAEGRPQIARDVHRVDCATIMSGKPMNLVRPQSRIEWIGFENRERLPRRSLLDF